jgi:S1-C subfamily serine protease
VSSRGVVVRGVRDSSPADKAGIRAGDVITELDHKPVANAGDMKRLLAAHPKGAPVVVLLHRDGNSLYAAMSS